MAQESPKNFFISYTHTDLAWAEWIAWELEQEGYSVFMPAWDVQPGNNVILRKHQATGVAQHTLVVLSPGYLEDESLQADWSVAFQGDSDSQQRKVLPVKVQDCTPTGYLSTLEVIDLAILNNLKAAQNALLTGVLSTRSHPAHAPGFPGASVLKTHTQPIFPGTWPEVWEVPYRRNLFFTGRETLLTHLRQQLSLHATALTQVQTQAIHGLGGIGKTQLALEYAYRYEKHYRIVLWISAATPETLLSDFLRLASTLQVPGSDERDPYKTVEAVKRWLSQQRDWLLILDNADDLSQVRNYLPVKLSPSSHILLTTRMHRAGGIAQLLDVEKMECEEGALLLLRRTRLLGPNDELSQASIEQRTEAEAIVKELDGLPLALDQAGAYIDQAEIGLEAYLELYRGYRKELLAERGYLADGHEESVASTWLLSFRRIEQENPAAGELLRLCAFLNPDSIPEELITEGAEGLGEVLGPVAAHPFKFNQAIEIIGRYSLIRRQPDTGLLSMHRLVQAVLKDGMNEETQKIWAERAIKAVVEVFPEVEYETWTLTERYLPLVDTCLELVKIYSLSLLEVAEIFYWAGYYWYQHAVYAQAYMLYQQALTIQEQLLEAESPAIANTLDLLALLYQDQGEYGRALPLYERALAIHEKVQGGEHPSTATTLQSLASLYQDQGEYERALPLYERALAIYEKVQGTEHPWTATTLHELARLYQAQGEYERALPLYERALAIHEKVQGGEHPSTATTLHELARLYQNQGEYERALPLYERALAIHEKVQGREHPETATTLHELARLYQAQGEYERALPLYERALVISEKMQGGEHPETATTLHALASLYQDQGEYERALPLYERALAIKEKVFGKDHSQIDVILYNLASLYQALGSYEQAEALLWRDLAIREKAFGPEDKGTITTIVLLIEVLYQLGKDEQARQLEQRLPEEELEEP